MCKFIDRLEKCCGGDMFIQFENNRMKAKP